ncbi:thioredoxin-like protein [Dyadobacter jejuensis]|uniref:Thioredoxin-like protein n=1 Tax=Dyadobacter jejuensis TaxID=1082580 RepID=A0A316AB88_9BACT|nr:thioredoxin family protein [Dyadobacter jejuensis]PWJ54985.1 thioredoxin-like protein [Dyadobacter jejuensis]
MIIRLIISAWLLTSCGVDESNHQVTVPTVLKNSVSTDSTCIIYKAPTDSRLIISFINEYGDPVEYSLVDNAATLFENSNFRTGFIKNSTSQITIPLFPGDSIEIDLQKPGFKWTSFKHTFKKADTTFLKLFQQKHPSLLELYSVKRDSIFGSSRRSPVGVQSVRESIKSNVKFLTQFKETSYRIYSLKVNYLEHLIHQDSIQYELYGLYKTIATSQYLNDLILCSSNSDNLQFLTELDIFFRNTDPDLMKYDPGIYKECIKSYGIEVLQKRYSKQDNTGANQFDFSILFDSAQNHLNGKELDYLRYFCTQQIEEQNLTSIYQTYLLKLIQSSRDQLFKKYLETRIKPKNYAVGRDIFYDENSLSKNLDSLIFSNKKKYCLVDIWASWCLPCIESIPEINKRLSFKTNSDINVIYISLDHDQIKWKNASLRHNLNYHGISLLLQNPRDSKFVKFYAIKEIPRYLLFDQYGKLLASNNSMSSIYNFIEAQEK